MCSAAAPPDELFGRTVADWDEPLVDLEQLQFEAAVEGARSRRDVGQVRMAWHGVHGAPGQAASHDAVTRGTACDCLLAVGRRRSGRGGCAGGSVAHEEPGGRGGGVRIPACGVTAFGDEQPVVRTGFLAQVGFLG